MMHLLTTGLNILQSLFTCSHANAHVVEGKTFCPDCGKGVVFRWVAIKCGGCHQRRPVHYRFRQVVPVASCCTYCGDTATYTQRMDDPEFFQLRHALLQYEEAPYAGQNLFGAFSVKVNAMANACMKPSQFSDARYLFPSLPMKMS